MGKKIQTFDNLVETAGGALQLAHELGLRTTIPIYRWKKSGIPHKYWERIIEIVPVDVATLHDISIKARGK